MSVPGNLLMIFLAAGACCVAGAAASSVAYPLLGPSLGTIPPARRCRMVLWWCATPALVALAVTAVCLAPSVGSLVGLGTDHCLVHDDHHAHLCLLHAGTVSLTAGGWAFILVLALWWLGSAGPEVARAVAHSHTLRRLEPIARRDRDGVRVLNTATPVAFAGGIVDACVYISSALVRCLPAAHLRVVMEHEVAHVRRRDGLRKLVATLLCATHFPAMRRRLIGELELACEQACDAQAAARVGGRTEVAEAIIAVERLLAGGPPAPAPGWSFVGSNVAARVETLLDEPAPQHRRTLRLVTILVGFGVAALAVAGTWVHHETEALVALLVR